MAQTNILSPLPGTYYRRPAPDQPAYKDVGDQVVIGEVVGLIEVMKSFIEVKSELGGKIVAFLIENEDPVMAGQPIIAIES
ncbi:MAG TPA: acetyl-CoA carboxylase [Bradyrhizobium sp.]|nr:acetyl-CoA carboxylase [Bradyrhizobium sp.]